MPEAFYEPVDGAFAATELTRGPWSEADQHAGPPTALIGREIELLVGPEWQLGRLTLEILRPISIGPLRLETRIVRPGRRVQLIEVDLHGEDALLVQGRGWVLGRRELGGLPRVDITPPPRIEQGVEKPFFETGQEVGYHTGMEFRFTEGGWLEPGPASAWLRMSAPLVAGEQPSALTRVLIAADTGNGISGALDQRRFLFINTDLTVNLVREPSGEWIHLDAVTSLGEAGAGLADCVLSDARGPIGRATQTLLIAPR